MSNKPGRFIVQSSSNSTTISPPMIIGVANTNHYLVGIVDLNNNLVGLRQDSAEVVGSIVEAKAYLRGNNIFSALLELDCTIDDMCGQSKSNRYRQRILC
ncbi:hypothetical protein A3Q33_10120 [Colwellia sp. PAMC 21821]|nr:hypothetical protein A3Q33_10120 [Colwellia sp. PAMC 21821]